jgi:chorismate dehydratase
MIKYKVGVVSYLNSIPFVRGIEESDIINQTDLIIDDPAIISQMLIDEEIDLGLIPVKIIHKLDTYFINTNYCIGAINEVFSVCIFSNSEIKDCHTLLLDTHSRTSVALAQILINNYLKFDIEFKPSYDGYENELSNGIAGVVIGDRAFSMYDKYKFHYDLSSLWYDYTHLPFVFAAWISKKEINSTYLSSFNNALKNGLEKRKNIASSLILQYPKVDIENYFINNISYDLDDNKRKGLNLFLELTKNL